MAYWLLDWLINLPLPSWWTVRFRHWFGMTEVRHKQTVEAKKNVRMDEDDCKIVTN